MKITGCSVFIKHTNSNSFRPQKTLGSRFSKWIQNSSHTSFSQGWSILKRSKPPELLYEVLEKTFHQCHNESSKSVRVYTLKRKYARVQWQHPNL
ncbi:hypothetical protein L3Y34_009368 [Caenorhabditis briggsae]|uniref:Uncharacterized protein n=1 Tax=Caenorhabditis briggsae TaxID=6238 RepID=A0AAE9AA34_CAEBR|nr:hypothetical protein L3Y34_009368 [Caenorhabditis briggsae]